VLKYFTSPNSSLMERLQTGFPDAKFVKAFNSVGSALMVNPSFPGGAKPTTFYCRNERVRRRSWRTSSSSSGGMPLCQLWCIPGFRDNAWGNHAFALLRR
jgi:8-hydroxy-5-deazaflavin:NADPH oxidoreductase